MNPFVKSLRAALSSLASVAEASSAFRWSLPDIEKSMFA
jgi:hypothetical protein